MIIQAISYGKAEEPFAFTYSGAFTDNRVNGVGTVRFNTSGTLTVLNGETTVSVYVLAGGGGGARYKSNGGNDANYPHRMGTGGGGGNQTVTATLTPGVYNFVVGMGGDGVYAYSGTAGNGGGSSAFNATCNGGGGGTCGNSGAAGGSAGYPNATAGQKAIAAGGAPNGGSTLYTNAASNSGGNGYIELTFS